MNTTSNNKQLNILVKVFFLIVSVLLCVNITKITAIIIAFLLVCLSVYNVIRSIGNFKMILLNLLIAYFNYSICIANYIFPIDDYFTSWKDRPVSYFAIGILFLFNVLYSILIKIDKSTSEFNFFDNGPHNSVIVLGGMFLLIAILIFGFVRPETSGERGSPSTIYEYSIILFIIVLYYSKTLIEKTIIVSLMLLFALQNLIYGGRVTALQIAIVFVIVFLENKLSVKKIIIPAILLLVVFTSIGEFRATTQFNSDTFFQTIDRLIDSRFTNNTSYSSYFTSLTFVEYGNAIDIFDRFELFGKFVLSMLFGGSAVSGSNLAEITRQYYVHYFGGVLPFFGYFYLSWFGLASLGLYLGFLTNKFVSPKNLSSGFSKCVSIYLIASCPRWYLYSPSPLIRGIFLLSLVYGICYVFHRSVSKV